MKTKLITALRTAAKALEDHVFGYEWNSPDSCNCGVVVATIMGKSIQELNYEMTERKNKYRLKNGTWTCFVQTCCPVTGIPRDSLLRGMFGCGLTARDIIDLEYLLNPKVLARMRPRVETVKRSWFFRFFGKKDIKIQRPVDYKSRTDVIEYMRVWADILTEEGKLDIPQNDNLCRQPEKSLQE